MSQADAAFASMDDTLFDVFGDAGTVQRGADPAVAVRVVLTRGAARFGEYGQMAGRVTTADFLAAEWQPQSGDVLTAGALVRKVESIESDDGHVVRVVLYG